MATHLQGHKHAQVDGELFADVSTHKWMENYLSEVSSNGITSKTGNVTNKQFLACTNAYKGVPVHHQMNT